MGLEVIATSKLCGCLNVVVAGVQIHAIIPKVAFVFGVVFAVKCAPQRNMCECTFNTAWASTQAVEVATRRGAWLFLGDRHGNRPGEGLHI